MTTSFLFQVYLTFQRTLFSKLKKAGTVCFVGETNSFHFSLTQNARSHTTNDEVGRQVDTSAIS